MSAGHTVEEHVPSAASRLSLPMPRIWTNAWPGSSAAAHRRWGRRPMCAHEAAPFVADGGTVGPNAAMSRSPGEDPVTSDPNGTYDRGVGGGSGVWYIPQNACLNRFVETSHSISWIATVIKRKTVIPMVWGITGRPHLLGVLGWLLVRYLLFGLRVQEWRILMPSSKASKYKSGPGRSSAGSMARWFSIGAVIATSEESWFL